METTTAAREAALRQYATDHDRFAEQEQMLVQEGKYAESQGAHTFAMHLLDVYQNEADDPTPPDVPWCDCSSCQGYIAAMHRKPHGPTR